MAPSKTVDALSSALVARFLRSHDYSDTLKAFLREADLAPDVGQSSGDDTNNWSIQSLLEEKNTYDQTVNFERYGKDHQQSTLWSEPGEFYSGVVVKSHRDSALHVQFYLRLLSFFYLTDHNSTIKTCCYSDTDIIKYPCCVGRAMAATPRRCR